MVKMSGKWQVILFSINPKFKPEFPGECSRTQQNNSFPLASGFYVCCCLEQVTKM